LTRSNNCFKNKNKKPDIISSKKFDDREENRLIRRSFDISKRCAKEIKLRAITEGIKDYDVVQRALNRYFGFDEGEKDD